MHDRAIFFQKKKRKKKFLQKWGTWAKNREIGFFGFIGKFNH